MKSYTAIVFFCMAALAYGYDGPSSKVKYADKVFLTKQKAIFEILQHVHQHEVHGELWEASKKYNIEEHYDKYTHVEDIKEFFAMYKHGLLGFDEVFTVNSHKHLTQVVALFHIFFYAKDWDTFYNTVVWARFHVNENMFIYALTVAVFHRDDTQGIELPAPYEVYPYYFFNTEVITKAQQHKMQGFYGTKKIDNGHSVVIPVNSTGWYMYISHEQKISYFTEDIGLNTYYYYYHADYPFWMGGKEYGLYKDRRGENFFFVHQQLLARYYMERLSNDLGAIPEFSWGKPMRTGYYPNLAYYNGNHFPTRDSNYFLFTDSNFDEVLHVMDWERRIRNTIDLGYIIMPDGSHLDFNTPDSVEYLGNLIQGNPDSLNKRYYGDFELFSRLLISASVDGFDEQNIMPGAMEQFETAMRDPMFYQLYKRITIWYWQFKDHLPSYTTKEVNFPGVKIESVEVGKLITFFDKFDVDITNAVDIEVYDEDKHSSDFKKFDKIAHHDGEEIHIKARTTRLNHLPFTVKLNVSSEEAVHGVVRMYLGPKYDQNGGVYDVNKNRENWFLLDVFPYNFVAGTNQIVRNSVDFSVFVKDRTTYSELYKNIIQSAAGEKKFPLDMTEAHCGIPNRLLLPKGTKLGMTFQFYFIVSPFHAPKTEQFSTFKTTTSCGVSLGARYIDSLPFGYPFDRKIDEQFWFTPNMYYYDVNIFHKKEIPDVDHS